MKYLFLLFLFLSGGLFAENIPEEKAKAVAGNFFQSSSTARTTTVSVRLILKDENISTRANGASPAFYVFGKDNGKGFVIVAGDDVVMPILGYSFKNNFPGNHLPVNLKDWLEEISEQINRARREGLKSPPAVAQAWTALKVGNPVIKLETALWNQDMPYNKECPIINGKRTYTGCTITATAIVMKYHEWPDMGIGTIPGYTTSTYRYNVPDRTLNRPYLWAKMPLTYTNYSTEEEDAVAALMYDCGVILRADYGPIGSSGTGASTAIIASDLPTYMKYDKSARYLSRSSYSNQEWHRLMQKELQEKRPIVYSGFNETAGHAFVLDGYAEDDYYSVNWGWGGYCNGYFLLSALEPHGQGAGGSGHYNNNQGAVIGLKKDEGGEYIEEIRFGNNQLNGFTTSETSFEKDKPFPVSVGFIQNMGSSVFSGTIMVGLTDKTGKIKQELYSFSVPALQPRYGYNLKDRWLTIKVPIETGDRIRAFYKSVRSPEWTLIQGNEENGCVWELIIADEQSIEESTSIIYNKKTKIFTLQVKDGVEVQLFTANGTDESRHCRIQGGEIIIDANVLTTGSYTLKLRKAKEYKELKFIIGTSK